MSFGVMLALFKYCPNCQKQTWQHNRGKRLVCRGDIRPSQIKQYEALVAAGAFQGCQREIESN